MKNKITLLATFFCASSFIGLVGCTPTASIVNPRANDQWTLENEVSPDGTVTVRLRALVNPFELYNDADIKWSLDCPGSFNDREDLGRGRVINASFRVFRPSSTVGSQVCQVKLEATSSSGPKLNDSQNVTIFFPIT